MRALAFVLILSLSLPVYADSSKPVSVASSLAWSVGPVALDYGATAACIQTNPRCYETNRHLYIAPLVIAGTVAADRWLSKHSRRAMWIARAIRLAYHGFQCARALALMGER